MVNLKWLTCTSTTRIHSNSHCDEGKQEENKELRWCISQTTQEIQDDVEDCRNNELYGYIGHNPGECFGEGMIEGKADVSLHNRPLRILALCQYTA
jgi:hypothetical protein